MGGITGTTQAGLAPIIFEISPEDLGLPLHFRLTVGETQDFLYDRCHERIQDQPSRLVLRVSATRSFSTAATGSTAASLESLFASRGDRRPCPGTSALLGHGAVRGRPRRFPQRLLDGRPVRVSMSPRRATTCSVGSCIRSLYRNITVSIVRLISLRSCSIKERDSFMRRF